MTESNNINDINQNDSVLVTQNQTRCLENTQNDNHNGPDDETLTRQHEEQIQTNQATIDEPQLCQNEQLNHIHPNQLEQHDDTNQQSDDVFNKIPITFNETRSSDTIDSESLLDSVVNLIHFNDCYNVEPTEGQSSGAAGFLTAVNEYRHLNPLILFSGDILSPSFMSTFTKGEQMIPVLNDIGVDCAVFGNHEFDYGVDNLISFVQKTNFPWLLSNVIDKETNNQLGDGEVYKIFERNGLKIGLIGLIEEEWLSTLSTLDPCDVIYKDFSDEGRRLAKWLKEELHVDYVIALTHARTPNDIKLSDSVPEIDLILGGHDHVYEIIKRPNNYIIKSGTDFREFSKIQLVLNENYVRPESSVAAGCNETAMSPIKEIRITRVYCLGHEEDFALKMKLKKFQTTIDEKMSHVLGQFNCDLDGTFSSIRTGETNLGNFVTDIMLGSTHADLAILNSGTLRSDRIHSKGDFTMRDLFSILGYIDPIAVLLATGHQIWRALENGVSQYPKLEGRFPQVSGCSFEFDPSKPSGKRINPETIYIGDEPLDLNKSYKLTTKAYLAQGKDGYDVLKDCKILIPGDESPDLTTSILNHFESIRIIKSKKRTHHRQSLVCVSRSSLLKMIENLKQQDVPLYSSTKAADTDSSTNQQLVSHDTNCHTPPSNNNYIHCNNNINNADDHPIVRNGNANNDVEMIDKLSPLPKKLPKRALSIDQMEYEQCKLEPKIEGRIRIVGKN